MLLHLASVAALVASTLAAPSHVLHERRDVAHPEFVKRSPVPIGRTLPVRIGLTQRNLDYGHDLLMEVSTPGSSRYGKHYSAEEVVDLFAPSKDTVDSVSKWLEDAGITRFSQSTNKQWMQFDAKVEVLEELVKARFHEYHHVDSGVTHVACDEYHVPAHIQKHVDYITPGIKLMSTHAIGKDDLKKRDDSPAFPRIKKPMVDVKVLAAAASYNLYVFHRVCRTWLTNK